MAKEDIALTFSNKMHISKILQNCDMFLSIKLNP